VSAPATGTSSTVARLARLPGVRSEARAASALRILVQIGAIEADGPERWRLLVDRREVELRIRSAYLAARARAEQHRIDRMVAFSRTRGCRRDFLLRYFGETPASPRCGRCDRCAPALSETLGIF